jgi:hypothetical protein
MYQSYMDSEQHDEKEALSQKTGQCEAICTNDEEITASSKKPPNFLDIPQEIRLLIYEFVLPGRRLINLQIPLQRMESFRPLLSLLATSCLYKELKAWFEIPPIVQRLKGLVQTSRWGFIDPGITTFSLEIDKWYRHREDRGDRKISRMWSFLRDEDDAGAIQNIELRFNTQDQWKGPSGQSLAQSLRRSHHSLSNARAVERVWGLPNLHRLEIIIRDFGQMWRFGREDLRNDARIRKDLKHPGYLIPIANDAIMEQVEYLNLHENAEGPALPKPIIKLWDRWPAKGSSGKKHLLVSYNVEGDETDEGGGCHPRSLSVSTSNLSKQNY